MIALYKALEIAAQAHEANVIRARAILAGTEINEADPLTIWARLVVLHHRDQERARA